MTQRTRSCGRAEATARLAKARQFLDVADVALTAELYDAAASDAAMAGIAAADVICCVRLGSRSAAADHGEAAPLLRKADERVAVDLERLLGVKYRAQYDHRRVTSTEATQAVTRAKRLVARAEGTLRGDASAPPASTPPT